MKNKYDYSRLKLSTLTSPEYRHILLLLGWVWYLAMYFITERFIPVEKCHVVHSVVDDMIPFVEYFILVYVSWYVLIVISLLYFFLTDVDSFKYLQIFIIVTQVVAMIVYIAWPSVQNLRPMEFERHNFCTWIMGIVYSADTPTGVCPSLHVAYSVGIALAWLKRKNGKVSAKIIYTAWCATVCVAVLFVKQHSFVDVLAAIPVCILAEIISQGLVYYLPKKKMVKREV